MNITVVYPKNAHSAYKISANEFITILKKVANINAFLYTDEEFLALPKTPNTVVLMATTV